MNTHVNPEMLTLARELRGMTQLELAELSRVDNGTISRYEGGLKLVLDHDLEAIADKLGFPTEFFSRTGIRLSSESGEVFHRKRHSLPAKQLHLIHAHLDMLRLNVELLLEKVNAESKFSIPRYNVREFDGKIDLIAALVRAHFKISPVGPVDNLIETLESAGCLIHKCDFDTDLIDETVQWSESLPPVILVNSRSSSERLRFTLAHMLGHLVMHHDEIPYPDMEKEADQFAAAFLLPAEAIELELAPVTLEHLLQLKPKWKVSIQALIHRAYDIGMIDETRYKSLFQMLSRAGYRKVEPFPLPAEEPVRLKQLFKTFLNDQDYGTEGIAKLLAIHEDDLRDWYLPESWRPRLIKGKAG
jgi:Zn-dependent peptidase ImmA (M78 family)